MLITNQTNQDYWFGPLHLPAGAGTGTLTVDDSSATSLYLTDDGVADAINTLLAQTKITVTNVTAGILFPRPTGEPQILHGDGSPEGLIYAGQGSLFMVRTAASAFNYLYTKTSGIHLNTGWVAINPGGAIAPYRKSTAKAVNTTVAATDLFNGEITIAAGVMGNTGTLRARAWGDWLNNSGGAAAEPRFQLVFGGTTVIDTSVPGTTINSGAPRGTWILEFTITNNGGFNNQSSIVRGFLRDPNSRTGGAASASFATGDGLYTQSSVSLTTIDGGNMNTGVDTSIARALVLNVINGSASASYETKLYGALVEII